MKIYVGNLSYETSENDLREEFSAFGETTSVEIVKDKYSGQSRGFAFVEMSDAKEAQSAIDALNNKELKGRNLSVNEARPRPARTTGGYGGGGGYSGGRGGSGRGGSGSGRGSGFGGNRGRR
ncbi:MAG: RNA-binding protein [Thermodesulfobacteriota bacterium]|nr:RNA-binding protein [Thermodesulfobacteriota bacterium]